MSIVWVNILGDNYENWNRQCSTEVQIFWNTFLFKKNKQEQSGAAEACWAHNPEVRRSKLRSARQMFFWWCNVFSKNFFVHSRLVQCHIDGSVVECSLTTWAARVRFPVDAVLVWQRTQKYSCERSSLIRFSCLKIT